MVIQDAHIIHVEKSVNLLQPIRFTYALLEYDSQRLDYKYTVDVQNDSPFLFPPLLEMLQSKREVIWIFTKRGTEAKIRYQLFRVYQRWYKKTMTLFQQPNSWWVRKKARPLESGQGSPVW